MNFPELCGRIAYMRDGGLCMYCLYARNRPGMPGSETDHVFGRGETALHHWILRLTLCNECHYQKHHGKDGWFSREAEERALFLANSNSTFVPGTIRQVESAACGGNRLLMHMLDQERMRATEILIQHALPSYSVEDFKPWLATSLNVKSVNFSNVHSP